MKKKTNLEADCGVLGGPKVIRTDYIFQQGDYAGTSLRNIGLNSQPIYRNAKQNFPKYVDQKYN